MNAGSPLTNAQLLALEAIADGHTIASYAQKVERSPLTIKEHMDNVRMKLGANNLAHAVAIAMREGVIS